MDTCAGTAGFRVVGFSWELIDRAEYRRHLFRQCLSCRAIDMTEVFYIEKGYVTCTNCLSQHVDHVGMSEGRPVYRCQRCHINLRVVDEDAE